MRLALALALALASAAPAAAQKRLTPSEPPIDLLARHEARVRLVLKEAYEPAVVLRAIVRPSFQVEFAVGLRRGRAGHEIFALRPARQIWDYESIELMKSGRMGSFAVEGLLDDALTAPDEGETEPRPAKAERRKPKARGRGREPADSLEDVADSMEEAPGGPVFRDTTADEIARLEEGLPENPADLPLTRCAVPVDEAVAAALVRAWRRMLEEVGPDPWGQGADGTDYRFALAADGRALEWETWSPRPNTGPARLAELAETMKSHCETPDPARLRRIEALARRLGGKG